MTKRVPIRGDILARMDEHDQKIREMESRFGGRWQELCLDIVNVPSAQALDELWEEVIRSNDPDYPDWQYPGQALRHLLSAYREIRAENTGLRNRIALVNFITGRDYQEEHNE